MKELEEHIILANIMAKEFAGELETSEKERLDAFLKEEGKQEMLDQVRENLLNNKNLKRYSSFDLDAARKKIEWKIKFQKKNKIRKLYNVLRYAAILALPIAITAWMVFMSIEFNKEQLANAPIEIVPGSTKAQLYLSDGRTIDLEGENEDLILELDGSVIEKSQDGLNYNNQSINQKTQRAAQNVVVTPKGGEYNLELSDGTKVWLNAESEIRYPVKFTGDTRKVEISGEVYFEVAKDLKKEFIVKSGDVEIKVLGTQFNVMAYSDERSIQTTLVEGAVRFNAKGLAGNISSVDLIPGRQADYDRFSKKVEVVEVNVENYIAWKNGKFIFEKADLGTIMRQLERWYDVKVFFNNEQSKNFKFSARIDRYGNIEDVLRKMELTTKVRFDINKGTVLVR